METDVENQGELIKKTYTPPILSEYGSLKDLTLGNSGAQIDGLGGTKGGG
jgi:hypothetical protein